MLLAHQSKNEKNFLEIIRNDVFSYAGWGGEGGGI